MTGTEDNNLQGAFGDMGTKPTHVDYTHPEADKMLEAMSVIMNKFKTGYSSLGVAKAYEFNIRLLKGKGEAGYSSESRIAYIHIPPKQKEHEPKQILDLIKAIRMGEQEIIGFTAPDPSKDMLEYASVIHAKNLDSVVFMCKFVYETEKTDYYSIFIDTLENLGHINIYQSYVAGVTNEELADTYMEE